MTNNINKLVRGNILNTVPYSTARDEYKTNSATIFLDANENPFNTGLNRYPDPRQNKLKEKISALKKIPVGNIFLGNGSDEIIDLLIRAFCEPGRDKIMINPPTYGMYEVSAQINGNEVVKVPLSANFELDFDTMRNAFNENLKILFLCSPNNPTGNTYHQETIDKLLMDLNCIVVIDEAYIDFSAKKSWIYRLNEFPNLVIMQTFSKARGLAGIRLGMAFANEQIINILNRIKLPYNINTLTINAAYESLKNQSEPERQIDLIKFERQKLSDILNKYSFIEKVFPSDSNFILCRTTNAKEIYNYLSDNGIIVRNRSGLVFCDNCLRITVGTPEDNNALINQLDQYGKKEK